MIKIENETLKELLEDPDKEVRFVVARTLLKKFKNTDDILLVIPIMAEYASDPEEKIVMNALKIIGTFLGDHVSCKKSGN